MKTKRASSPTRTYVAICRSHTFPQQEEKKYFRKFHLPTHFVEGYEIEGKYADGSYSHVLKNDPSTAEWYFLNQLNFMACIDECIRFEDFCDIKDQDVINAGRSQEYIDFYPLQSKVA